MADRLVRDPRTGHWVWLNEQMLNTEPAPVADIRGLTVKPYNAQGLPGIPVPAAPPVETITNWLPKRVVDLPTQTRDPQTGEAYNKTAVGLAEFVNSMGREYTQFADSPTTYFKENPISTALNMSGLVPLKGSGKALSELTKLAMTHKLMRRITPAAMQESDWAAKYLGQALSAGELTGDIHALKTEAASEMAPLREVNFGEGIQKFLQGVQKGQQVTNVKGIPNVVPGKPTSDTIRPIANWARNNLNQWQRQIDTQALDLATDISEHLTAAGKLLAKDRKALVDEILQAGKSKLLPEISKDGVVLKPTRANINANLDAFTAANPRWQQTSEDLTNRFTSLSQYPSLDPNVIKGDLSRYSKADAQFMQGYGDLQKVMGEMAEVKRNPAVQVMAGAMDASGKVVPGLKPLTKVPGMQNTADIEKLVDASFGNREQFARLVEAMSMNPGKIPEAQSLAGQLFVDKLLKTDTKDMLKFMRDKRDIMNFAITDKQTRQGLTTFMEVLNKRGRAMDVRNAAMQFDNSKMRTVFDVWGMTGALAAGMSGKGLGAAATGYVAGKLAKGAKMYIDNKYMSKILMDPQGAWMLTNLASLPKTAKNGAQVLKGVVSLAGRMGLPLRQLGNGEIAISDEGVGGKELFAAMGSTAPNPAPSQASPKSPSPVR